MYKKSILIYILLICNISFAETETVNNQSISDNLSIEEGTQEISNSIMSPFCPGRTLAACPSEDARQLKMHISSSLKQGYSADAIKRQLTAKYGPELTGLPSNSSFGSLAFDAPIYFLIGGIAIVFLSMIILGKRKKSEQVEQISDETLLELKNKLINKKDKE